MTGFWISGAKISTAEVTMGAIRISAHSGFVVHFDSDVSNTDWGYKITVMGASVLGRG